jgi:hypothetical protein
MRRLTVLVLGLLFVVPSAMAGELAGVSLPDEISVGDDSLVLNGMGLRKKAIFKVYVAGLYLEDRSQDPAQILASDGTKRVVMHFLTGKATKKKMDAAWHEGFEANSPKEYPALSGQVQEFADFFGDMKDGDRIELTIVPGSGTTATLNGSVVGEIEGDDFGRALLAVWLGDHPPSDDLKDGLLGK